MNKYNVPYDRMFKLQNEATLVGLNINEDKTKYMQIKRTGTKDMTHLNFDNFAFEHVENFNYLGSILNADNKMNIEIAERIAKATKHTMLMQN